MPQVGRNTIRTIGLALVVGVVLFPRCGSRSKKEASIDVRGSVAVLPFVDRTGHDSEGLGNRLSDQFASRLALGSLSVVDRAQVEAAFAEAGLEIPERLAAEDRRTIREVTGCEAVVTGFLAEYEEGTLWDSPKVALAVRFVDLAGGGTIYRDGGVSPVAGDPPRTGDAERLALVFAGDLADRMNDRIHAKGGALPWR